MTADDIPECTDQKFLMCPREENHKGQLFFPSDYPFKRCQVQGCGELLKTVKVSKSSREFKVENI